MLAMWQLAAEVRALVGALRELLSGAAGTDPFHRLFTGITALAQAIYQDDWRTAELGMAHLRRHPRGGQDPYGVTAATPWPPDDLAAAVELRIQPDGFGPAAFAVVPILLIHECICHVPARQDRAANDSTFAEGLMDWVGYFFHDRWAVALDPELAPAARQHAEALRNVLTRGSSAEAQARRAGHRAAHILQAWFEGEPRDSPIAERLSPAEAGLAVARLAVQLNTVDRSLADKDHFVSLLSVPLPPQLEDALRGWYSGRLPAAALLDVRVGGL
jgi:hypothetical protein